MKTPYNFVHLTIQATVKVSAQIMEIDVRKALNRVGQRIGQAIQADIETTLSTELFGEPGEDWEISNIFTIGSDHTMTILRGLIQDGRCTGLKYAIRRLQFYQESALNPPDLLHIIESLEDELEKEERRG